MFNRPLILRLVCVALVAVVMLPLGAMVFPYIGDGLSGTQFHAIEAVVSTTLGFGIFSIFG
jgi:hypothetical protein